MLQIFPTKFDAAKVYVPDVFEDDRGFFKEIYSQPKYAELGMTDTWPQDSMSWSSHNVIRGMHYDPRMAKLVQCVHGRIYDVIVDLRDGSPTYKQWQGFILSADNHRQLYVPPMFAHGFLVLSDEAVVAYKNSATYDPSTERAISWREPSVGIVWPLVGEARLSTKDAEVAFLA